MHSTVNTATQYIFLFTGIYTGIVYPSVLKATIGSIVQFYCDSNDIYKWKYNGKKLPKNAVMGGPRNDTLIINSLKNKNEGSYECHFHDALVRKRSSAAFLTVSSK